MKGFLFKPRIHYVGLGAFMWLGVYITENPTPTWLCFLAGGAFGVLNDLTKWEQS